jgi:2-iminobutanoate/2-iminopropanoate deaminase
MEALLWMVKTEAQIRTISTPLAAPAGGHYSQAIAWGELVFVSGQLPVPASGAHLPDADFESQCRQALTNVFSILAAVGAGREHILKVTAYIVGVAHWPAFDRVYAQMLGATRPARSVVPVPELHHGYLVEIEVVAALTGRNADLRTAST